MCAAAVQPPERPPRDPRLLPYLQNRAMIGAIFSLVGMHHAGDEPNPRPLPQTTLYDFKRRCAAAAPTGSGPAPEALHFAFYADRFRVAPEKAITVPAEHLWWLAAAQDTVLLSDRVTHHYTEIAAVDREGGRISFHEPWPDAFFLLPGRNTLGIEARLDPGLSISREEFLRAIAGLVTWDTPRLIEAYLDAFPDRRGNSDTLLRCGFALLDAEADLLAPFAAGLCHAAARHASAAGHEWAPLAARQTYIAAACGVYFAIALGDAATREAMQTILRDIVAALGKASLEDALTPPELARLAVAAGNGRQLDTAIAFCNKAAARDPDFEDAYWLRASARAQLGSPAAVIADARRAIELNDAALARLAAERAAIDPRGKWELQWKDAEIAGRRGRRESELAVLLQGWLMAGEADRARETAHAMIALDPSRPVGHLKLALVERLAGRPAAAATALRAAIAREPDAENRARYEALVAEVEG